MVEAETGGEELNGSSGAQDKPKITVLRKNPHHVGRKPIALYWTNGTVVYGSLVHCTVLSCLELYCIVLYCIILYRIVTVLYPIVL